MDGRKGLATGNYMTFLFHIVDYCVSKLYRILTSLYQKYYQRVENFFGSVPRRSSAYEVYDMVENIGGESYI